MCTLGNRKGRLIEQPKRQAVRREQLKEFLFSTRQSRRCKFSTENRFVNFLKVNLDSDLLDVNLDFDLYLPKHMAQQAD